MAELEKLDPKPYGICGVDTESGDCVDEGAGPECQ